MESPPPPTSLLLLLPITAVFLLSSSSSSSAATPFPKEALPTKSGYLKVNSTTNSSIFFTFYESQTSSPNNNTPIIIWLQGGPGCSSMLANFYELGPWLISPDQTLNPNSGSWNRIFGLLFLDNPIGAGFSIASSIQEIPKNQFHVAKHLFTAITSFISLDFKFKNRPIYITGESYAGKYLPVLGYYIVKKNQILPIEKRVNLRGVAIGNGLTHPIVQVTSHGANAYNLGLINEKQRTLLEKLQFRAVNYVKKGDWIEATNARTLVLDTLSNMTGLATLYDFRRLIPYQDDLVGVFLNNVEVKRALGANESIGFEVCSDVVGDVLMGDVMKSVKRMVEFLVKETKVLLYQGQCDLRDGVVSTLAWVRRMRWDELDEFMAAERKVWRVDGKVAGYVQKWKSLSHVVVMNAGHLVPTDQPRNAQVMIEDWVLGKGLFGDGEIEEGRGFKGTI